MIREEAKELLPIILAFVEGKQIEYSNDGEDWSETETPTWDTDLFYRIKPETKYRPFKTQEECWQEMIKHEPFGWLKTKNGYCSSLIGKVYTNKDVCKEVWIVWTTNEKNAYSASDIFNNYTFADGTPFGIKED